MSNDNSPSHAEGLQKDFPQLFVAGQSPQVLQLAGDASSRKYFRVTVSHESSHKTSSYVLQEDQAFSDQNLEQHPYIAALKFFEKLTNGAVPKFVGASPARGWILLQDLGDTTLQAVVTTELYEKALDLFVDWVTGAELMRQKNDNILMKSPNNGWAFDFEKLNAEMKHTAEFLIEKYFHASAEEFLSLTQKNSEYLAARSRVLCHRDYHCRNLMFSGGKLFLIDFQDARWGPLSYDLVSLLWDPYVKLSEKERKKLLEYWKKSFLKRAAAEPTLISWSKNLLSEEWGSKSFSHELERMKIQRLLKAAGSYASFLVKKGRSDYLPSITPALHDTCEALHNLNRRGESHADDERLLTFLKNLSR